ncbi:MAG TPA: C25 family cysteine peptidase, partial [Anaerolineaceae bacterium]|nr:C25 family cysteine peptidase [Anaerolineaceae bacterium]
MNMMPLLRLVTVLGMLAGASFNNQVQKGGEAKKGLFLRDYDQDALILEAITPEYRVEKSADGGQIITVDGAQVIAQAGEPRLPVYSALIGVPPGAEVRVEVHSDDAVALSGAYRIALQPQQVMVENAAEALPSAQEQPALLSVNGFAPYPAAVASVGAEAWVGNQRVVRIEAAPFQVIPATGALVWHRQMQIAVHFVDSVSGEPVSNVDPLHAISLSAPTQRPYETILQGALLNYEQAKGWRAASQDLPMAPAVVTTPSGARTRIAVEQDGLYRLNAADLTAAGYDLDALDPRQLHLYTQGQEVAFLVLGEDDGKFDSGDLLLFYGQKLRGDLLAARYAAQDDNWPVMGEGWQPQFTPVMIEKYSRQNVYWLVEEQASGLRMPALVQIADGTLMQSNLAIASASQNNRWWSWNFTSEDTWLWERIQDYAVHSYQITLFDPVAVGTATVRGELTARTATTEYNPDHHTHITFNGALVEDAYWDGISRHAFQSQVSQSVLTAGINTLRVNAIKDAYPGEVSQDLYFDWYEVTYERLLVAYSDQLAFSEDQTGDWYYQTFGFTSTVTYALNVTDPLTPAWAELSSGSGLAELKVSAAEGDRFFFAGSNALRAPVSVSAYNPPDLLSAANGADYIIITVSQFSAAAQRLADQRTAQGLQTRIVLFEDLVNQFNEGIYHPLAIKSFLSYAYTHWDPAPSFVVLIGDGHFNLLNDNPALYGSVNPIYLPPNLEFVDFTNGEIDATNNLANIVGTDMLADIAIGRIPVNSVAELNVVIDKILAYENGALNQPWHRRVMLVADNTPDSAGDFTGFSDDLFNNYLSLPFVGDKVYLDNLSCPIGSGIGACPQVTAAIAAGLNDPGAQIISYIGHGHIARWTNEQVMNNTIAATMTNLTHLPVALAMTCYDGYWGLPSVYQPSSLEEILLRNPNGGTVSGFGATGWGTTYDHHLMERGIFEAMFTNNVDRLGLATD